MERKTGKKGDRMTKPIRPQDVKGEVPNVVIEIFNMLINKKFSGSSAVIYQKEVVKILVEEHSMNSDEIFDRCYLDVEEIYRKAGWRVVYDKPAYNESYDAYWVFGK